MPRRARSRSLFGIVGVVASALLLSGCIPLPPATPPWQPTHEDAPAAVAPFFQQTPGWRQCDGNWCSEIEAPMDWFHADSGETISLSVLVRPAAGERRGAIFYNPGGPGGSGVEYVRDYAEYLVPAEVLEHYDLVGFDPRGVGGSTPISCYDDPATLYDWLYEIPDDTGVEPLSDEDLEAQLASAQEFADACLEHTGDYLGLVGTEQVASDLDLLRSMLGEEQLNYLGVSYGTLIGSTYADLFPENVGRMVLDAVVAPNSTDFDGTLYQAKGFELAYGNFLEDCLQQEDCPFTGSKEDALQQTRELLDRLDAEPIPSRDGRQLGSGTMFTAIAANLYADFQWETLRQIVADVLGGSAESAFAAADEYYGVNPNGTFRDNSFEALIAVNCLDYAPVTDFDEVRANAEEIMAAAPTLGPDFVGLGTCAAWPFDATREPHEVHAPGANPIVAIGGVNDPATPYQQAVDLAEMLESGVLISVDAEGHGQYGSGNACVDGPVNEFFLTGTPPTDGLRC